MANLPSRLKMVNAAVDLFHKNGINATSVDQVLADSGTGKGQFAHYFKNKDGLVRAAITHLHEVIKGGYAPTTYEVRTWKEMDNWFRTYVDYQRSIAFERSCPIGTIGNDLTSAQDDLRKEVQTFLSWGRSELAKFFADRVRAGELPSRTRPRALADFCMTVVQGGMLLSKINRSPAMFENAAKQASAYINSLRIRKRRH
jgi:AcrR family transcriptional regulator